MTTALFSTLEQLYADMERAYDRVAGQAGLTCSGCPDNCCTSYFQHHTYVEWAYLWKGLHDVSKAQLDLIKANARDYVYAAKEMVARQSVPDVMCPLNEQGRCTLYAHRLMICRLHGVPNTFTLPNGQSKIFSGCFRCREILEGQTQPPMLERTVFYRRLAALEMDYLRRQTAPLPKVRLTLAEMIHQGPPPGMR